MKESNHPTAATSRLALSLTVFLFALSPACAGHGEDARALAETLVARDMMHRDVFPVGHFGMLLEDVETSDDGTISITTTGARFKIHPADSTIECHQRLGRERHCATLTFSPDTFDGLRHVPPTTGAAIWKMPAGTLRINGDSLLQFAPDQSTANVQIELHFNPEWNRSAGFNWLKLDNYGGLGVFVIGRAYRPVEPGGREIELEIAPGLTGEVLWVSIAPPRPFHWEESVNDHYYSQYFISRRPGREPEGKAFPTEEGLRHWQDYWGANHFIVHNPLEIWQNWQVAYDVHEGDEALHRTIADAHKIGMRVLVYASPLYYVKGTPVEELALRRRRHYAETDERVYGAGWPWGDNIDMFLAEIKRLLDRFDLDGLYYDNLYPESLVQSYRVMRETRRMLGPDRKLVIHTTWSEPFFSSAVFCPTTDAYCNISYRGEDDPGLATKEKQDWMRYVVGAFNVSNAIGSPTFNKVPVDQLNDAFMNLMLDTCSRLICQDHTQNLDVYRAALEKTYHRPGLADLEALKARVERLMAERQEAWEAAHSK
jgi:hypothetical protein